MCGHSMMGEGEVSGSCWRSLKKRWVVWTGWEGEREILGQSVTWGSETTSGHGVLFTSLKQGSISQLVWLWILHHCFSRSAKTSSLLLNTNHHRTFSPDLTFLTTFTSLLTLANFCRVSLTALTEVDLSVLRILLTPVKWAFCVKAGTAVFVPRFFTMIIVSQSWFGSKRTYEI